MIAPATDVPASRSETPESVRRSHNRGRASPTVRGDASSIRPMLTPVSMPVSDEKTCRERGRSLSPRRPQQDQRHFSADLHADREPKSCWFPFKEQYKKRRRRLGTSAHDTDSDAEHKTEPLVFRLQTKGANGRYREQQVQAFEYHGGVNDNDNDNATTASQQQVGATELVLEGTSLPIECRRSVLNETATTMNSTDDDNSVIDAAHLRLFQEPRYDNPPKDGTRRTPKLTKQAYPANALEGLETNCMTEKFWVDEIVDGTGWRCLDETTIDHFPVMSKNRSAFSTSSQSYRQDNGLIKDPYLSYEDDSFSDSDAGRTGYGDFARSSAIDPKTTTTTWNNNGNSHSASDNIILRDTFYNDLMVFQHELFEEQARDGMQSLAGSLDENLPMPRCASESQVEDAYDMHVVRSDDSIAIARRVTPDSYGSSQEEKKDEDWKTQQNAPSTDRGTDSRLDDHENSEPVFSIEVEYASASTTPSVGACAGSKKKKTGILSLLRRRSKSRERSQASDGMSKLYDTKIYPVVSTSRSFDAARANTSHGTMAEHTITNTNGQDAANRMNRTRRGKKPRQKSRGRSPERTAAAVDKLAKAQSLRGEEPRIWTNHSLVDDDDNVNEYECDDNDEFQGAAKTTARVDSINPFRVTANSADTGDRKSNDIIDHERVASTPLRNDSASGLVSPAGIQQSRSGTRRRQYTQYDPDPAAYQEEIETIDFNDGLVQDKHGLVTERTADKERPMPDGAASPGSLLRKMKSLSFVGRNNRQNGLSSGGSGSFQERNAAIGTSNRRSPTAIPAASSAGTARSAGIGPPSNAIVSPLSAGHLQEHGDEYLMDVSRIRSQVQEDQKSETSSNMVNTGAEELVEVEVAAKSNVLPESARIERNSSVLVALNRAHEMAANSLPESQRVVRSKSEATFDKRNRSLLDDADSCMTKETAFKRAQSTSILKREEFHPEEDLMLARQATANAVKASQQQPRDNLSKTSHENKKFCEFMENDFALVGVPSRISMPNQVDAGGSYRPVIYSPSRTGDEDEDDDGTDSWMDANSGILTETFKEYEEEEDFLSIDLPHSDDSKSKSRPLSRADWKHYKHRKGTNMSQLSARDGQLTTISDQLYRHDKFACIDDWLDAA